MPIVAGDTPETLAERVLTLEHETLPRVPRETGPSALTILRQSQSGAITQP